jgi:hypothetical protein
VQKYACTEDERWASFVAERELLGMGETYIPRTIFVACGQPKDLWKRLVSCFTCCKSISALSTQWTVYKAAFYKAQFKSKVGNILAKATSPSYQSYLHGATSLEGCELKDTTKGTAVVHKTKLLARASIARLVKRVHEVSAVEELHSASSRWRDFKHVEMLSKSLHKSAVKSFS